MSFEAWIMLAFAVVFLGGGLWFGLKRAAKSDPKE
jgi:hypothetical protein